MSNSHGIVFDYFIMLYFIITPEKPVCFLMRGKKKADLNWWSRVWGRDREDKNWERAETIIRIYYVRKKSIFSKKKNKKKDCSSNEDIME